MEELACTCALVIDGTLYEYPAAVSAACPAHGVLSQIENHREDTD